MKNQFIVLVLVFIFFLDVSSQPILSDHSNQSRQLYSNNSFRDFDLSQTLQDVCELIYSKILGTPGAFIEKIEGSFYDDYLQKYIHGCMFLISGTWSQLGKNPSPIDQISDLLTKEGWSQNYEYSADDPDGTTFSLIKDGNWCIVHGRWDCGDDSDSTYVPLDNYQVIVLCGKLAEK